VSERRWALEIDSILLVDSSIGRPCTSLVARGERRRSSSTRSRRAYRRCAIQPAIWDALEAGRRTTARRSSATSSSASTPSRTRTTHSAPSRRARRQRDPPADCQALGGELLLALERDALCTTVGSITDPGSHVAHGGRPSLILDLISADCTRRARSTLIRTRSPTPPAEKLATARARRALRARRQHHRPGLARRSRRTAVDLCCLSALSCCLQSPLSHVRFASRARSSHARWPALRRSVSSRVPCPSLHTKPKSQIFLAVTTQKQSTKQSKVAEQ
jgi:hypothetical protein